MDSPDDPFAGPSPQEIAAARAAALMGAPPPPSRTSNSPDLIFSMGQNDASSDFGKQVLASTRQQQLADYHGQGNALRGAGLNLREQKQNQKKIINLKNGKSISYDPSTGETEELDDGMGAAAPKIVTLGQGATAVSVGPDGKATTVAKGAPKTGRGAGGAGGIPSDFSGLNANQIEALWSKLNDAVSTTTGRANLNAQSQAAIYKAQALEKLLGVPDLNTITPQQLREAGTALAGLVSRGGSQAVSQIEHVTPESYASRFADFKQKLLNEPQGAEAGKFLQNMLETTKREKDLATEQMRNGQLQHLPRFAGLAKLNPGRYRSMLKAAGIDPDSVDVNGLPVQAPTAAAPTPTSSVHTPEEIAQAKAWLAMPEHATDPLRAKIQAILGGH